VFSNLIANAIKYRHPDRAPVISVSSSREGDYYHLKVRDNGIGIAPEHYELVFQLFKRLHSGHEYPGTGIGLTITQRVVERHGGKIWVESVLGVGTVFHFTLPATTFHPVVPAATIDQPAPIMA
jgi:signal transduction histidine kinase